jgi:transposase-like protein
VALWTKNRRCRVTTPFRRSRSAAGETCFKEGFTGASKCLADDLDVLIVHLRYPIRHRRRWRWTNLLDRSLGEVKRRTKVMGRFRGEESCLTLVWAVLDLLITHQTRPDQTPAPDENQRSPLIAAFLESSSAAIPWRC